MLASTSTQKNPKIVRVFLLACYKTRKLLRAVLMQMILPEYGQCGMKDGR